MSWIDRREAEERVRAALQRSPVVVLTGPRQVGKSTLARSVVSPAPQDVFDLENPNDLARLAEPMLTLAGERPTIVIDEAQLQPDLFPILRVLVDQDRRPGRFLVLGSASPDLVGLSAESLAGRVAFVELTGFGLDEVGADRLDDRWFRGGMPEAFLADDDELAGRWLDDYVTTFLQRDLGALGFGMSATTMRRFWSMLAHYHGQTWNGAALARSVDISESSVRRYVDALTDALVVRQLQPWHANLSKRQVKSPRVYVRDTGVLHRLLRIGSRLELDEHPQLGASWESMVIEHLCTRPDVVEPAFWSTHSGAEVDLRLDLGRRVVGVEVKRTAAPKTTKSMHAAIESLELDHLYVVHAGEQSFRMTETISALPASQVLAAPSAASVFGG